MTMEIELESEVAGVVLSLTAAEGASVAEGDEVMVIESMKMEIPVLATSGGTLAAVAVAEGDAVAEGQVLARIRP
ncbi:acetyl-CoA carboxylase biotin carboxyl carrier protein subunit [Albimonas sp. CAU 1670]|uniref:acetyl-CoA carboxylase biotin carboxyl carrier protein subunit n=1 Tax=Albimonas sp. CAU 1670 TaxID=3032599 RepID=UPI0023D9F8A3|nr:acetyl-CoA carboxylase biotin carboxyl carrier protein subunit [Albimonas sp. CAU 1670]MDF2234117.1 acetyl-CoA carboxylase biotin carboxyl carrier protein subunit [Albimonas sp. CAU 1670]